MQTDWGLLLRQAALLKNLDYLVGFYAGMELGGPRPARVRIWLRRAPARLAAGECGCASRAGRLATEAARMCDPAVVAAIARGNAGHVDGAVKMGLRDAASALAAPMPIAQ